MFSFSSTHRELCFNSGGFRSEEGVVGEMDTRWQSKSSLSSPPTYIPNDDVILFRPLYHMAQTGSLLPSMWIRFDFQWSLIPLLRLSPALMWLSRIYKKPHSVSLMKSKSELIVQCGAETSSPIWPHIHRRCFLMDFKYGCDLNSDKKQFSQH